MQYHHKIYPSNRQCECNTFLGFFLQLLTGNNFTFSGLDEASTSFDPPCLNVPVTHQKNVQPVTDNSKPNVV